MTAATTVIELQGVTKRYSLTALETYALRNVSLRVHSGEFVAVTGPSGCGKSTLMSILGLLTAFDQGCYRLAGRDVGDLDGNARAMVRNRHIGFVFQSFHLIGDLDVLHNVALPLRFRGGMTRGEREDRAGTVLKLVGLEKRLSHYPHQLSGGQQQRVAVARALVGEPDIILADEPTGNLDSQSAEAVMDLFTKLNAGGTTLCMVTHNAELASRAQRQMSMLDGQIQSALQR
ncbi:MAG TPA: ABC transporter ATP-binding protein [Steroidobacteraceae bacterium]|nr:ABC transporter ATP-binding protein [Steroidobacteraceae bacterium]